MLKKNSAYISQKMAKKSSNPVFMSNKFNISNHDLKFEQLVLL